MSNDGVGVREGIAVALVSVRQPSTQKTASEARGSETARKEPECARQPSA